MIFFNRFIQIWGDYKGRIAVFLFMCMIFGLMWSRAILSLSIVLAFANALQPSSCSEYWQQWRKNKFSLACFLFFLAYVITGFWSHDAGQWWDSVTNKLPFAVLPFAILALPLKEKWVQKTIVSFLLLTQMIIVIYSSFAFFLNVDYYVHAYNISHSLPTTKYNDHIRFSLSLVGSSIVILYYIFEEKTIFSKKSERILLLTVAVIFFLYLHLLAAKTGLLALYSVFIAFSIYLFRRSVSSRKIIPIFWFLLIVLPIMLYYLTPTFHKKVNYVHYELKKTAKTNTYSYNLSDAGRILSYQMAIKVWQQHQFLGTGAGDLKNKMDAAYAKYHPEVPAVNRLIPHNQFLFCFVALGLVFGLSLLILCWVSFFCHQPPIFYGRMTSIIMIIAMLAEAMLEIQFGVFIFLFFLLFWQKLPISLRQRR